MPEEMTALKYGLAVLATWRVTHLLSKEDGPGEIVFRLRVRLGEGFWGNLIDCFKCLSLWVAAPIAIYLTRQPIDLLLVWLATSGGACLLERIGQESLYIQPVSHLQEGPKGEDQNGLLWPETGNAQEPGDGGIDKQPPGSRDERN